MFDFNNSLPDAAKLLRVAKAAYDHTEADHLRKFDAYSKAQFNGRWRTKLLELNFQDWKVLQPENPIREMIQTYLTHVLGEEVAPDISPLALGDQGQATLREYRIRRLLDDIAYNDEHDAAIVDSMHSIGCTYFGIKAGGAWKGDAATVKLLLDHGADIEAPGAGDDVLRRQDARHHGVILIVIAVHAVAPDQVEVMRVYVVAPSDTTPQSFSFALKATDAEGGGAFQHLHGQVE